LDLVSGESQTIIDEDLVAQGRWLPNGEDLAYILATPTTYELRLRRTSGEDLLLASDVSFAWSVSPSGKTIAFSRESGYETPGEPGLYVVDLETGEERQLSDIDKAGAGSLDDRPIWSPDNQFVFFSTWGTAPEAGGKRLVAAAVDGSDSHDIEISTELSGEWWADDVSATCWFTGSESLQVDCWFERTIWSSRSWCSSRPAGRRFRKLCSEAAA
jgi:Tol biopolymer transport system component